MYRRFNRAAVVRQERFVKSLDEVRLTMDNIIGLVNSGYANVSGLLDDLNEQLTELFRQAERLDGHDRF